MKIKIKTVLLAACALLLLALVFSAFYVVQENEYACVVRFSKIIETVDSAGLHLKMPFVDHIKKFPKAAMLYDISPSEVLTADKQNMTVDSYVLWQISDPLLFYQSLGSVNIAEERLDAITYNAFKNTMGTLAQGDIINEENPSGRNDIYSGITNSVSSLAKNYGIQVLDVKIKRFDLPESNEQAVYSRMISERNQIAEKYKADGEYEANIIRNNVDKQVDILVSNAKTSAAQLEAEGESAYMRMLAQAYNTPDKQEFYRFMLALDTLKTSLSDDQKVVILGADSELAQILSGAR